MNGKETIFTIFLSNKFIDMKVSSGSLDFKILSGTHLQYKKTNSYSYDKNVKIYIFRGKNHENPMKIMVFGVYLSQYAKFRKMFRI